MELGWGVVDVLNETLGSTLLEAGAAEVDEEVVSDVSDVDGDVVVTKLDSKPVADTAEVSAELLTPELMATELTSMELVTEVLVTADTVAGELVREVSDTSGKELCGVKVAVEADEEAAAVVVSATFDVVVSCSVEAVTAPVAASADEVVTVLSAVVDEATAGAVEAVTAPVAAAPEEEEEVTVVSAVADVVTSCAVEVVTAPVASSSAEDVVGSDSAAVEEGLAVDVAPVPPSP